MHVLLLVTLGNVCRHPDDCYGDNVQCTAGTCQCVYGYEPSIAHPPKSCLGMFVFSAVGNLNRLTYLICSFICTVDCGSVWCYKNECVNQLFYHCYGIGYATTTNRI